MTWHIRPDVALIKTWHPHPSEPWILLKVLQLIGGRTKQRSVGSVYSVQYVGRIWLHAARRAPSPSGRHCCISHLAEHIRHIRGVTNPFLVARTFQRASVPVNITSSGFHTSEQMCVWHTDKAKPGAKAPMCDFDGGETAAAAAAARSRSRHAYFSSWSICVSAPSLEWLIRGEVEKSVRVSGGLRWRVLEPSLFLCWHLLTSVYHLSLSHTPLLLTLATPQLSKDPRRLHYSDCP